MHDRAHRTRGEWFLLALAIVAAAVFVRLGVWQLERLSERREINAARAAALSGKPVRFDRGRSSDPGTIDSVQWRRVQLEGHWDPEREVVIRGRAFLGTPGVQVATLFRPLDMSPVLVLRGWLPAADGVSADLDGRSIRRDTGLVRIHGLAIPFERPGPIPTRHLAFADGERPVLGTLDFETVSSELGVALSSWVLQLLPESGSADGYATSGTTSSTVEPASSLRRLPAPPLSNGPHALYAFQWFGFAAIALAGGFLLPKAARRTAVAPLPEEERP